MARNAELVDVLIASPGDAAGGRDAIERALHDWNAHRSDSERFILRPRRWETGSIPLLGRGDGQSVINSQLVDRSDIVVAIFYNRVGTKTPRAVSGTVEEIRRSVAAGKLVHLYFAEMDRPSDVDPEQLLLLRKLRSELQQDGLVGTFRTEDELQRLVANAIEYDLIEIRRREGYPPPNERPPPNTLHRAETDQANGTGKRNLYTTDARRKELHAREEGRGKFRLWTIIAVASAVALATLLIASPEAPNPSPPWIAVPGVFSFFMLVFAAVRLIYLKSRHR